MRLSPAIVALSAALILPISAPALADEADIDTTATASADNEPGSEELVCTYEPITGSRIRRRVCRTQQQIDQDHERASEFVDYNRQQMGVSGNRTR